MTTNTGPIIIPKLFCILIGSHISNQKRIEYLEECLISLARQTLQISIYLSISFQSIELAEETIHRLQSNPLIVGANRINIRIRSEKTPQMRHIQKLVQEIQGTHEWILFCDDDDTYEHDRAMHFASYIAKGIEEIKEMNKDREIPAQLLGCYESTFGKDHREHRHEYWCYCVHIQTLIDFYAKLEPYPDVLNDRCCDVLFAEYLRRSSVNKLFGRIVKTLYNYRVDNNSDSITGVIKSNQPKYTNLKPAPPREQVQEWAEYVVYWNEYLYENIDIYIHDTYLRTLVGCDLDYILRAEFMSNYSLNEFVDPCHIEKIRNYHERLRTICNEIYDLQI